MKNTKRALFSSVIALILCFSMLVGTTFAWFTDEVKSGVNQIVAGNLDVELYNDLQVNENKKVTNETKLFDEIKYWEPGVVAYENLTVANLGTLALKYQLSVNFENATVVNGHSLAEALKVGFVEGGIDTTDRAEALTKVTEWLPLDSFVQPGELAGVKDNVVESKTYGIVIYWEPGEDDNLFNMNNENKGRVLSIDLGIKLFATQLQAESDSFGPDYDKDAPWTGGANTAWYDATKDEFTLNTAEQLAGLAELVNGGNSFEGKTIKLSADMDLNNVNWTPIGKSGSPFKGSFIGTGYTISNLKASGSKHVGLFGNTFVGAHIEGVTVVNANISGNDYVGVIVGGGYLARNSIKDCVVENAYVIATPCFDTEKGVYDGGAKAGGIVGQAYNGNITGCTVKNSTIVAYRDLGGIAGMLDFDGGAVTVEASGNTVEKVTLSYIGVAGKYDGNKPNQNMGVIVGRVGSKAVVNEDANTATEVKLNEEQKDATLICTLDELITFAKDVNAGNTYAGKTVILGADIDLGNIEWTPIGTGNGFKGIFDGNGHTISNLKITGDNSTVGLFANTYDGEIKNLTVENAVVSGYLNVGVVAGNPYTSKYTNITVKGHVEVNGFAYVGGVGGKNAYADWTDITVAVDEASYVKAISTEDGKAYRTYVGGVVGFNGEGSHTFKNITSNIDVIGDVCDIGGVFGIAHYGNNFENISCTGNVTNLVSAENDGEDAATDVLETGLIAGVWHNQTGYTVTFKNISATGTISTPNVTPAGEFANKGLVGKKYSASGTGELIITNYAEEDGITYALDIVSGGKTLYLVPAEYEGTTVNVPEGVTAIGGYAFAYNDNIETIVLPSSVTTLNDRAFRDTSASKVVLNEGLTNISYQAFRNALNVTEVEIPSTVTTISKEAFQNSGITTLTIPANVTTLEYGACRDMKEVTTVTIKGNVNIPAYAFRSCPKLETVYIEGTDVTFNSGMIFSHYDTGYVDYKEGTDGEYISKMTIYVANEVIKNRLYSADSTAKLSFNAKEIKGAYTIVCKQTPATDENGDSLGYYVDQETKTATTYDAKGVINALEDENVETVVLAGDVTVASSEAGSNSYGATGINVTNGQAFDGNGNDFGVNAWDTWDSAISTTGGVIKNVTINKGMRGVFVNHNSTTSSKVYLENVIIDGTVYTISCDQGTNQGLEATNCTFNGWTSYAATTGEVKFVGCSFGEGQGYAFCRPYAPTAFVGCNFEAGFAIDARAAVTFENCYLDGVLITAENLATLVTSNIGNATVK